MNNIEPKILTLSAIVLAFLLIDELNSTEQNALGNWFMLVGQTLCTNGSENFRRDWSDVGLGFQTNSNNTKDVLNKVSDMIKTTVNKL